MAYAGEKERSEVLAIYFVLLLRRELECEFEKLELACVFYIPWIVNNPTNTPYSAKMALVYRWRQNHVQSALLLVTGMPPWANGNMASNPTAPFLIFF